jgi:DNA-binding transcriptional ArsR family regulator
MPASANEVSRTLSDPTRRGLSGQLCREGERSVRALTDQAGVSQPAVSKHLGILKCAGLVRERPRGRQALYRAPPQGRSSARDRARRGSRALESPSRSS